MKDCGRMLDNCGQVGGLVVRWEALRAQYGLLQLGNNVCLSGKFSGWVIYLRLGN